MLTHKLGMRKKLRRKGVIMSKEEKSLYEQMGGTYTEIDGIFYPDVTLGD